MKYRLLKKTVIFIFLICSPYVLMLIANETIRSTTNNQAGVIHGYKTMNISKPVKDKCTWACHNDTTYCKNNHVKTLKPYFEYTDPTYFGIINLLHSTGNYGVANIVFLVLLIPLLILYFILKAIDLNIKTKRLKNKK